MGVGGSPLGLQPHWWGGGRAGHIWQQVGEEVHAAARASDDNERWGAAAGSRRWGSGALASWEGASSSLIQIGSGGERRGEERLGGGGEWGSGWRGGVRVWVVGDMGNGGGRLGLCPVGPVGGGAWPAGPSGPVGGGGLLSFIFFCVLFFCFIFCIFFLLFIFCSVLFFLYNSL